MGDTTVRIQSHQQYEREHLAEIAQVAASEKDIIAELWVSKKDRIKKYEMSIRERFDLGDKSLEILGPTQISSYIRQKYKKEGASEGALAYIRELLEEEHRRPYSENENGDGTTQVFKDDGNEDDLETKKLIMPKMKPVEVVTHEDALEAKKLAKQSAQINRTVQDYYKEVEEKAKAQGWVDVVRKEPVDTRKGDPRKTESWEALGKHIKTLQGLQQKLYEFPPTDEEDAIIARGIEDWDKLFEYSDDAKYTQSFVDWTEMLEYFYGHGKNAAGKQWAVDKPMLLFNKETNTYEVIPVEKRKYTREQVGDQNQLVEAQRQNVWKAIPIITALTRWHRSFMEPNRGDRKNRLGPILSELKFGGGGNLEDD